MSAYLDASVLVALFVDDVFSQRAKAFLTAQEPVALVSDFAAAEFASAIARDVRSKLRTIREARTAFATFDVWVAREAEHVLATSEDIGSAAAHVRGLDLNLRAPDAINIALALRVGAALATFDGRMRAAAGVLGLELVQL